MRMKRAGLAQQWPQHHAGAAQLRADPHHPQQLPGLPDSGPMASRTGAEFHSVVEAIHSAALALLFTQITEQQVPPLPPKP